MGIAAAIHQSGTGPSSREGGKGPQARDRERFPWEHGSTRDMWRGRLAALLVGAVLASLVILSNGRAINALEREVQHFKNADGFQEAGATPQRAKPARPVLRPPQSPTLTAPVAPRISSGPVLVQLGSFSSEAGATAASDIMRKSYATSLKGRTLTISKAIVRQVRYHRVVIDLQSEREARDLCRSIQKQNGDCLVWTESTIQTAIGKS